VFLKNEIKPSTIVITGQNGKENEQNFDKKG
jgi:hypothetical protein